MSTYSIEACTQLDIVLTLENWYVLAAQAKHRSEKNSYSTEWRRPKLARKIFLVSAALLLLMATAYPLVSSGFADNRTTVSGSINRVIPSAGPTGIVYVSPGGISPPPVGSSFTVQVKVANMALFNGWDIQIVTGAAPLTINATSLSITGNIFAANTTGGSAFEIIHCVNGVGTGCTSSDGPGIVHSAFGDTAFTSGGGILFTITYKVLGNSAYNPIPIQNSLISSSSPSGVPHSDQSGSYGIASPIGNGGGGTGKALTS